jgi:RluA family pseudouridine synthase
MSIVNIAAYQFSPLDQLQHRRETLREICQTSDLKGTILLSREGINMFIAGARDGVDRVLETVRSIPGFEQIPIKESITDYQPFNRMLVKIKQEIIPVGCPEIEPDPNASPKLSPRELKRWLDENRQVALLDTRNDYEVSLGTFQGAIDLNLKTFREFPAAAAALSDEIKKQPVVMFCTGGIRCEKIGPYMKGLGFEQIYQLEGGILKYFEECQQEHYQGTCFVFDQRVAVDPSLAPTETYECFACKHVLTPEDCSSPKYREGVSCPHCYQSQDESTELIRRSHQERVRQIAASQPGCQPYENRRWISIPKRCDQMLLIDALQAIYPPYSKQQWLDAIESGEITAPAATKSQWRTLNVQPDSIVREGQRFLHAIPNYTEPPIAPDISIVYEDQAIVVVDKSAPLPLHPSGRYQRNTLEWILHEAYFPEKLRPAHRIDAMTTGLVVFTRKYAFASKVQSQFAQGSVEKTYLAWVAGNPSWQETRCELAISALPLPNGGRALDPSGQPAITVFRRIRCESGRSLVEAKPITGRTHQIRLHLAALGHPILGDPLYRTGGTSRRAGQGTADQVPWDETFSSSEKDDSGLEPMQLHAWKLALVHPISGCRVEFQAHRPGLE